MHKFSNTDHLRHKTALFFLTNINFKPYFIITGTWDGFLNLQYTSCDDAACRVQNVISFTQSKSLKKILHERCKNCDKFNTLIEWNWVRWILQGEKNLFKYKTTSKLVELPNNYFILQKCVVSYNFYPNLPIFLYKYICHICDILQSRQKIHACLFSFDSFAFYSCFKTFSFVKLIWWEFWP